MRSRGYKMRIVVIGAGIVGSSIAFHLARRDAEVILIDRSKPGTGASSHSFAWINAGHKPPFAYHDFNRRSMDIWDRFSQQLEVDVGLRWGGKSAGSPHRALLKSYEMRQNIFSRGGIPLD